MADEDDPSVPWDPVVDVWVTRPYQIMLGAIALGCVTYALELMFHQYAPFSKWGKRYLNRRKGSSSWPDNKNGLLWNMWIAWRIPELASNLIGKPYRYGLKWKIAKHWFLRLVGLVLGLMWIGTFWSWGILTLFSQRYGWFWRGLRLLAIVFTFGFSTMVVYYRAFEDPRAEEYDRAFEFASDFIVICGSLNLLIWESYRLKRYQGIGEQTSGNTSQRSGLLRRMTGS